MCTASPSRTRHPLWLCCWGQADMVRTALSFATSSDMPMASTALGQTIGHPMNAGSWRYGHGLERIGTAVSGTRSCSRSLLLSCRRSISQGRPFPAPVAALRHRGTPRPPPPGQTRGCVAALTCSPLPWCTMAGDDAWIAVWHDPLASLSVISAECTALADLSSSHSHVFIVATRDGSLRLIDGARVVEKRALTGEAVGIAVIRPAGGLGATACIAVAIADSVFVYRNLRPYFKFSLPSLELHAAERHLWQDIAEGELAPEAAVVRACKLRDSGTDISLQCAQLCVAPAQQLTGDSNAVSAAEIMRKQTSEGPPLRRGVATAMCSVDWSPSIGSGFGAASSGGAAGAGGAAPTPANTTLLVGTESGTLLLLGKNALQVDTTIRLHAVPHLIRARGAVSTDLRIAALCRDGKVHLVKNNRRTGVVLCSLPPCDLALLAASVVTVSASPVAPDELPAAGPGAAAAPAARNSLEGPRAASGSLGSTAVLSASAQDAGGIVEGFNPRNCTMVWRAGLPSRPLCLCAIETAQTGPGAVLVAMADGSALMIRDGAVLGRTMISSPDDRVVGMRFGRFGREPSSLVALLSSGSLVVRMLRRTARLTPLRSSDPSEGPPLALPKRTRLHVANVVREQDSAGEMYRTFVRSLSLLALRVRREYVGVITSGMDGNDTSSVRHSSGAPSVRAAMDVSGIGPTLHVGLTLTAPAAQPGALAGCLLLASSESGDYSIAGGPMRQLPSLAPGCPTVVTVAVTALGDLPSAGRIRLLVVDPRVASPLLNLRAILPAPEPASF